MRIQLIVAINSMTCLIGGGLIATAVNPSPSTLQLGLAAGGLLLSLGVVGFSLFKVARAAKRASDLNATMASTGITEFDELRNSVLNQLQAAGQSSQDDMSELAEMRDLLETIDRRKGGLDQHGNRMTTAERLRIILKGYGTELDASIRRATSCGRELKRAVDEIVSGSENQSDLMSRATGVVEELSAHIISVCDTAEDALKASCQAKENAENGLMQFRELAEDMKRIRNHVAARERKLQTLGQHTKDIESIVATIGSLSSRTDLLALNASIESVRAGEHGRGFAVVAEEVRALAEQSAQAVVDITSRIEMIQRETHQSISGASGEHDQMHQVIERVTSSLDSLEVLCEAAEQSANGLTGISTEANRQLHLAQQVVAALEQSTDSSQQNRTHAEGAHWTAKTLTEVGDQLDHSMELFRLTGAIAPESQPVASQAE